MGARRPVFWGLVYCLQSSAGVVQWQNISFPNPASSDAEAPVPPDFWGLR